jgi:hypothetical protein
MVCTGVEEKVVHDFSSRHIWVGGFTVGLKCMKVWTGFVWLRIWLSGMYGLWCKKVSDFNFVKPDFVNGNEVYLVYL